MKDFIERRGSVSLDSLLVAMRADGLKVKEEEVFNELQELVASGELTARSGKWGGVYYGPPGVGDAGVDEMDGDSIGTDAKRLLVGLQKTPGFKDMIFCAANVWDVFGRDLKLGTPGRIRHLLLRLETEGDIVLDHIKNSPGGPSRKYLIAGAVDQSKEIHYPKVWEAIQDWESFSINQAFKAQKKLSREEVTALIDRWEREGKVQFVETKTHMGKEYPTYRVAEDSTEPVKKRVLKKKEWGIAHEYFLPPGNLVKNLVKQLSSELELSFEEVQSLIDEWSKEGRIKLNDGRWAKSKEWR